MRVSASQMAHIALGRPEAEGCADVPACDCWVCGSTTTRAMPLRAWMGGLFTGQTRARSPLSQNVCEGCAYMMAGAPPNTFRMWSVLVEGPTLTKLNKGAKAEIRAWLRREKRDTWFAAIAESGQKHIVPWAPVNGPGRGGSVAFEDRTVQIGDWQIVDDMTEMLTRGATKEELQSGDYGPRAWDLCGAMTELGVPRESQRVAGLLGERGSGWGRHAIMRRYEPQRFTKLLKEFPELSLRT